jgi:hypothetical protein
MRIFPSQKPNANNNPSVTCTYCGIRNHTEQECHKRIAEEYMAKQARKTQGQNSGGGRGKRGKRGGRGGHGGNANLADANSTGGDAPAYSSIFGGLAFCSPQPQPQRRRRRSNRGHRIAPIFAGLAFCLKAAANENIKRVNGVWVKDNGATHHMHHDKALFTNYHRLKHRLYVGGIGTGLKAIGIGDVEITDPTGKTHTLKGVLHVPGLKCGLMSLNTLALIGMYSLITETGCTVSNGDFKIHSPIRNGLCVWSQDENPEVDGGANALFAGIMPKKTSLTDLHERLAHTSKNTSLKFGPNAIADLHLYLDPAERTDEEHQTPCPPCITGKHHRTPFVPSDPGCGGNPLELVHSDLVESHVKSTGGGKWVVSFVDHATQFSAVFILPDKNSSTVLNTFKEFQAWAERQSGCKIKNLRTNRGTEYMGEMIEYVKAQGIDHQPTAGYSPQSNGIAERFNRTLFKKACTMMDAAGAPLHLWADTILAANLIFIRLASSAINGITPFEAWYGHKATIAHIRKWGCKVYRHIHKKTGRKKFHKKSMLGYLVGYEKGDFYRIYHPISKAFKISRDTM